MRHLLAAWRIDRPRCRPASGLRGDPPAELREHAHVLDAAGEIPRRIVLVGGLVVVLVVVCFLLLQQRLGVRTDELLRLADRQRRHAAFREREMIGTEEVAALGMPSSPRVRPRSLRIASAIGPSDDRSEPSRIMSLRRARGS